MGAKAPAFQPPGTEEVAAYCAERGNGLEAGHFVDYYAARGWMVGKNRMKDWKAAVRTWERNARQRQDAPPATAGGNIFADMAREMRERGEGL